MQELFDSLQVAKQAKDCSQAILKAQSLRMTEISAYMQGSMDAAYKRLTRFLNLVDPRYNGLVKGNCYGGFATQIPRSIIADPTEKRKAKRPIGHPMLESSCEPLPPISIASQL
jgi:site-specific DNA-adenine methylase